MTTPDGIDRQAEIKLQSCVGIDIQHAAKIALRKT
jgi:hypothetical protein